MKHKRNPLDDEFGNGVIAEMQTLISSVCDKIYSAQRGILQLERYIARYDDGSWDLPDALKSAAPRIGVIAWEVEDLYETLNSFKDPEE